MIENSIEKLRHWYIKHPKTMIALSGGVDSCLVAYLGRSFLGKENSLAVIGDSPSLKRRDLQIAIDFCNNHDIAHVIIHPDELNNPNYAANPANRCYYCKSHLYESMLKLKLEQYPDFKILNGSNADDIGDYRPGMEAAVENNALSPLMDCHLGKQQVRQLAQHFNLEVWDKPASPCLSSRFPYGESINKEKLALIEKAETYLFDLGFKDCRVRYFNGTAKIEVPFNQLEDLQSKTEIVTNQFIDLGFHNIEIDTEGLISGKLNRALGWKVVR